MNNKEYQRIHDFVRKQKKEIKYCEHCGLEKKLDCALINGLNHEKNPENYICLCRKCHYKYDNEHGFKHTEESKNKIGISSKERILKNGVNINFVNSRKGAKLSEKHIEKISESMKGENHHQSKLKEEDIIFIKKSDKKPMDLAIKFNVTYKTIWNIKNNKTWKHLD